MDISDSLLWRNRNWDPNYLLELISEDFYEFAELWDSDMADLDLISQVEQIEKYCPIVEDISLDNQILCSAVEKIEEE